MGNPSPPGEGRGEGNGTCRGPVSVVFCPASASLQRPAQEELHPLPFPSPSARHWSQVTFQSIEGAHDGGDFFQPACQGHATGRPARGLARVAANLGQP